MCVKAIEKIGASRERPVNIERFRQSSKPKIIPQILILWCLRTVKDIGSGTSLSHPAKCSQVFLAVHQYLTPHQPQSGPFHVFADIIDIAVSAESVLHGLQCDPSHHMDKDQAPE